MSGAERSPNGAEGGRRPKALVVTRNLPPIHGGIERLMQKVVETLALDFDCHVVGPRGCSRELPPCVRVTELPAGIPWFLLSALFFVVVAAVRHRFALCVAGNGLVAPLAATAARLGRAPWITFVHGLDLVVRHRAYQGLFVPILRRARFVVANSRHTAMLAESRRVPCDRIRVIAPGVSLPDAPPPARVPGRAALLSVGRLVPRKGLADFVEHALPRILQRHPSAHYTIVGAEPREAAMQTTGEQHRILLAAQRAGVAAHVTFSGALPQPALEQAYRAADVLVFPSRAMPGDAEGFGMVILEAAAQGVPAVAFDAGGVGDAMSPDNGVLVAGGDHAAFADAVVGLLDGRFAGIDGDACRRHAERHSWGRFATALRGLAAQACDAA